MLCKCRLYAVAGFSTHRYLLIKHKSIVIIGFNLGISPQNRPILLGIRQRYSHFKQDQLEIIYLQRKINANDPLHSIVILYSVNHLIIIQFFGYYTKHYENQCSARKTRDTYSTVRVFIAQSPISHFITISMNFPPSISRYSYSFFFFPLTMFSLLAYSFHKQIIFSKLYLLKDQNHLKSSLDIDATHTQSQEKENRCKKGKKLNKRQSTEKRISLKRNGFVFFFLVCVREKKCIKS